MVKFAKSAPGAAATKSPQQQSTNTGSPPDEKKAAPSGGEDKPAGFTPVVLTGAKAQQTLAQEQQKAQERSEQNVFRFFVPFGEERRVTFVTGKLDAHGVLDVPMWFEHRLQIGGRWTEIYCLATEENAYCEACEFEASKEPPRRAQFVAAFWVINHTPYKIKSGQNAGKVLQDRLQPFVTPRTGLQVLQNIATKMPGKSGLIGHTFDVSRTDKQAPRTGDQFFPVGQHDVSKVEVPDIATVIRAVSNEDMKKLGIGVGGYGSDGGGGQEADDEIPF